MFLLVTGGEADTEMSGDMSMSLFVAHLISGVACMNFFSHLSCDFDLLRGKVGCRPGAFLLYFGCRYLSILSIFTTLIFYDIFSAVRVNILSSISQGAAGLSFGFASSIMIARTCTMFPNKYFCVGLEVVQLGFWGLNFASLGYMAGSWDAQVNIRIAISMYLLAISTCAITVALVHAFYLSRHEHHYRIAACCRTLLRDTVPELALVWAASVSSAFVFLFDASTTIWSQFTLAYSIFIVITLLSCRVYRKMLEQLDYCPIMKYSYVSGWIKAVVVYVHDKCRFTGVGCKSFFQCLCPRSSNSHGGRHTPSSSASYPSLTTTSGRKPIGRPPRCIPARSRSTYAQSSLYTSHES